MMHKKRYAELFLLFIVLIIFENCILITESKATSYNPITLNFRGLINPDDFTSINFNLIGSRVEILSDVEVYLTTDFHPFVFSRQISVVVNNTDPIDLTIEWFLNREVIKDLFSEELPTFPTLKDLVLLFNYNCYFRISSNSSIDKLTLKFDKIIDLGLDPSKQYILTTFISGDSEWKILPTEENWEEKTSESYLESTLTNFNDSNSYYFTICEKTTETPQIQINWVLITSITVTIGLILISLVLIISKQDYIHYLKNRYVVRENNRHRLSLEEVLENENRSIIIELILKKPGIHFNELLRESKISSGTLVWHLDILLSYKIIGKKRFENYLIYFPYYLDNPLSNMDLKLQKSELTLKLMKLIKKYPGIYSNEIAKRLNVNRKTIQYHLEKLIGLDLISKERIGRKNQLYIKVI